MYADKGNPFVNNWLSALLNVVVPVISLPLTMPVMVSMSQTPVLPVGDAMIVPPPGKGTPP